MAYLSSYLSGGSSRTSRPKSYTSYALPKSYSPSSVSARGTNPIESGASQPQSQDLASALLYQKQISKASAPSSNFESSYNYDPVLAKIQALASESVANATTDSSQLRKDALIQSGAVGIGQELGFDPTWISAAQQNPESEWAQLQKEYTNRQQQLLESESAQNLLYSGDYVRQLNELAQGKASAEGGIGARLRDMLSGVDTNLLASKESARQQELAAQQALILQANYSGSPVYDPSTGSYIYPSGGVDSGGSTVYFDMTGAPIISPFGLDPGSVVFDANGNPLVIGPDGSPTPYSSPQSAQSAPAPVNSPAPPPAPRIVDNSLPLQTYLSGNTRYQ